MTTVSLDDSLGARERYDHIGLACPQINAGRAFSVVVQ